MFGAVHYIHGLDVFPIESGSNYVIDKVNIDFGRLHQIHKSGAFYVTRAKDNFKFVKLSSKQANKSSGVISSSFSKLQVTATAAGISKYNDFVVSSTYFSFCILLILQKSYNKFY
ncbi:MAG: hypothetical protein ABIY35_04810 [Chitinophagaceae bacterium]